MKSTIIAIAAILASSASAMAVPSLSQRAGQAEGGDVVAQITAVNHDISGKTVPDEDVVIPLGRLTHFADLSITELQLKGAATSVQGMSPIDASKITCQRYNDEYGTQIGSAPFTTESKALISTNEVGFGWVLCYIHA